MTYAGHESHFGIEVLIYDLLLVHTSSLLLKHRTTGKHILIISVTVLSLPGPTTGLEAEVLILYISSRESVTPCVTS